MTIGTGRMDMPRRNVGIGTVVAAFIVLGWAGSASAQEVRWRHDYTAARKEATATGRPLLLDFGNEGCVWCRKLDATTFRDPGVVATLNERFIPVKVDGDRDEWLTRAVGVQAFPTLVLVSPEGRVIARHEGYADVVKMTALLRQAPPKEAPRPVVNPNPLGTAATDLLTQARADHDAGRYLSCIGRCDKLISDYPTSAAATEARRLSAGITADPEKWRQVTGQLQADLTALHRDLDAALKR